MKKTKSIIYILTFFLSYNLFISKAFPLVISSIIASIVFSKNEDLATVKANIHEQELIQTACFSPAGCCKELALYTINNTTQELAVSSSALSDSEICNALHSAAHRGINVQIFVDNSTVESESCIHKLNRIPVHTTKATNNSNYLVSDRKLVFTGSYSLSALSQTSRLENCLLVKDNKMAIDHILNFNSLYKDIGTRVK